MGKLRVACILDNTAQSAVVCDLIDKSRRTKSYSIELLITHDSRRTNRRSIKVAVEHTILTLIKHVEILFVGGNLRNSPYLKSRTLNATNIDTLHVDPIASQTGSFYRYPQEHLEHIRTLNLDVLLCIGDGHPSPEILNLFRFGAIALKFASNRAPGLWEIVGRERSTYFVIQRLTGNPAECAVLFAGGFPTAPFYTWNLVRACLKANYHLGRLLEDLGESQMMPEAINETPFSYPLDTGPSVGPVLPYVLKTCGYLGEKAIRRIQGKARRWGVAYQFVNNWKSAILCGSTIIKNPPNRYLADPFIVFRDGYHVCLVEDFDYATGKGKISAFKITEDSCTELGIALEENFHLSYPFVFEDRGELYMCPESIGANDIRLYKCISFPLVWRFHKILIPNISAADTNIFKLDGRWWMLTNIDSPRIGEHCSELHLFYADTFDSTAWKPHRLNPIVTDPLRARNGGLLISEGNVYRVFQVHGFDMYGESMGIAKITKLTEESYAEEFLCSLTPKFFPKLLGTHTYSFEKGLLAFDFVKVEHRRR